MKKRQKRKANVSAAYGGPLQCHKLKDYFEISVKNKNMGEVLFLLDEDCCSKPIGCATNFSAVFLINMQLYREKMVANESFKVLPIFSYNFRPSFW